MESKLVMCVVVADRLHMLAASCDPSDEVLAYSISPGEVFVPIRELQQANDKIETLETVNKNLIERLESNE